MIYAYIFVMAGVTYLIRMLPLTLFQKKNYKCLYPFVFILCTLCLSDRYDVSGNFVCDRFSNFSVCGLVVAVIFALKEKSLVTVACFSCIAVFVMERILSFL